MATKKAVDEKETLVRGLALIVEKLDRNMNQRAEPPVPFRGVVQKAVEGVFRQLLVAREHPAAVNHEEFQKLLAECEAEAVNRGLIGVGQTKKFKIYYSAEELLTDRDRQHMSKAAEIAAML